MAEDFAHESVINSLIKRIVIECGQSPSDWSVTTMPGGAGSKSLMAVKAYARECKKHQWQAVDLLIVASDANCVGFVEKRKQIHEQVIEYPGEVAFALPNPHIERWLLLDPRAFKLGVGLSQGIVAPTYKCKRDYYKLIINQALRDHGIVPL